MASRQFSLVVFRALAVYVFVMSMNQVHILINLFFMEPTYSKMVPWPQKYASIALWAVQVIVAAFLWTSAERLGGQQADSQPTLRAGNWVVRLVFSALGILIACYAITSLVQELGYVFFPDPMRQTRSRDQILFAVTEGIRLAVGLGLFLTYRFDKAAAFEAAQAIESKPEAPAT